MAQPSYEFRLNTAACTHRDFNYFINSIRDKVCWKYDNGDYKMYHGRRILKHPDNSENIELEFLVEYENGRGVVRKQLVLIVRGSDLYVIGFRNQHGLFRLNGETLPLSTELPFEGTYYELQRYGKPLGNVMFGLTAITNSIYSLTRDVVTVSDAAAAVLTLVLNIAESSRYNHIRNHVCVDFLGESEFTDLIGVLIRNWGKISGILVTAGALGDDIIQGLDFSSRTARGYITVLKYVAENV